MRDVYSISMRLASEIVSMLPPSLFSVLLVSTVFPFPLISFARDHELMISAREIVSNLRQMAPVATAFGADRLDLR